MHHIYLDNNATTHIHPNVKNAMLPFMEEYFGNPSSLHLYGQKTRSAIDSSRIIVANFLGARPEEIIFTGSGTESNNLAIKGLLVNSNKKHIITSSIEHKSIIEICKYCTKKKLAKTTYVSVDNNGIISLNDILTAITDDTFVISIMLANNETGVIQNIKKIVCEVRKVNKNIIIHTDATQAIGKIDVNVNDLGVDMLSMSGHKLYGPKGIGVLFVRRGVKLDPIIHGASHEWNLRAGTENVAGIVGLGEALQLPFAKFASNIQSLKSYFISEVLANIAKVKINGDINHTLPNTVNISFIGVAAPALLTRLDMNGIAVSTGSACSSGSTEPSYILRAMGLEPKIAYSAIRFSFGYENTKEEIDIVIKSLTKIINLMTKNG